MPVTHIPRHIDRVLALLVDPFPGREADGGAWVQLLRALVGEQGRHAITSVNTADRTFTIAGDRRLAFGIRAPRPITVGGSTGNNGVYSTRSVALVGADTVLTVVQAIPSAVADGTLEVRTHAIQELEDDARRMLLGRTLAAATGEQLDGLGELLGLARTSLTDTEYRADLYAQVAFNVAKGTPEEIIATAEGIPGVTAVRLLEPWEATVLTQVIGAVPRAETRRRLCDIAPAGVTCFVSAGDADEPLVFGGDRTAADVLVNPPGDPTPGEGLGEAAPITAVNQGARQFTLTGNSTAIWIAGTFLRVRGSTGNDGRYTRSAVALVAGDTVLTVAEAIPSPVADGDGLYQGPDSGEIVEIFEP